MPFPTGKTSLSPCGVKRLRALPWGKYFTGSAYLEPGFSNQTDLEDSLGVFPPALALRPFRRAAATPHQRGGLLRHRGVQSREVLPLHLGRHMASQPNPGTLKLS